MKHVLKCYEMEKADLVRGEDCYLYDTGGRRHVDFEAGLWAAGLGHNHPRVNRVLISQAERVSHLGYRYTNTLSEDAAVSLLGTLGIGDGKCTFLSSGSEAVELSVAIARQVTGKPRLLTLADAFLSAYGSAGKKGADEWTCFDWRGCAACSDRQACDPACALLSEIPFDAIAALVFEPGNTSGLVHFPPEGLVRRLAEKTRGAGGLVVVDEVTTGLGRTGEWYGFRHYDLTPDIVAMGKGLGNGYPVSAVAMTGAVAVAVESSSFRYAQSHQNDPLACAVAKEVIAVIAEERLVERSAAVGALFRGELEGLAKRHDSVSEIRGRGLMLTMTLAEERGQFTAERLYRALLASGFLVGCNPAANLLRFYPPLTIEAFDIAALLKTLDRLLTASFQ